MIEVLFCVLYFVGMFVYFSLWWNLIDHRPEHDDALPITFQMVT